MRAALLAVSLAILCVAVLIASQFLQEVLVRNAGYRAFVAAAAAVGPHVAIMFAIALALDVAGMATFALRRGKPDLPTRKTIDDGPMAMGLTPAFGRSKRKRLLSKKEDISVESLVDGTATFGERMIVLGISVLFVCLPGIFLGAGLALLETSMLIGVVFAAAPSLWAYKAFFEPSWRDYRAAKAKLRARGTVAS